jgi:hypothetical protein
VDVAHADLSLPYEGQDPQPRRIGEGAEDVFELIEIDACHIRVDKYIMRGH